MSSLGPGWIWIFVEKSNHAQDEARCTQGALEAGFVNHRLLYWVQLTARAFQPFDGGDLTPADRMGQQGA